VIAKLAREMNILTVGVVTKPFSFEGKRRFAYALEGLERMKQSVDTLIVIPNDKIFNIIDKKTTFKQAFSMIDKILYLGVQGISDLIIKPGDINIDFADIKMIMSGAGTALLGIGYGQGEDRAIDAARRAVDNPLVEASLDGATNIIFAVTGGEDLTPMEVQEAARVIEEIADPEAMIVWGMTFDDSYEGEVKVSIIATGFPEVIQEGMLQDAGRSRGALSRL
jgi:cell division protein FtsZ